MLLERFFLLCFFLQLPPPPPPPTPCSFTFFSLILLYLLSKNKEKGTRINSVFVVVNLWQCIHLCNQTLIWLKERVVSNCVETKSVIEQIEFAFEKFLEKKTHLYEPTPQPPG